jgi:hypothetical protein
MPSGRLDVSPPSPPTFLGILINLGGRKYVKIPAVTAGHLKTYFPLRPLTLMHGGAFWKLELLRGG